MKNYLRVMLMVLVMPIEFVLGILWVIIWLITLPFDYVWNNTIQTSAKNHLLKGK